MARSLNCVEGPTATPCGKCASCLALAPGGPGNLDVIELDAASHNGVEDMRELREKAIFQPAESRYRIFIIDEAHMITASGFNALLKIVEEPPEHLIFIFATTEPEKVLPTIRSRTHHYPFRLLTPPDMRGLLERIVASEGVAVDPDVYPLVIAAGGGSPRDSLSILDQLIAGSGTHGVDYETSAAILGVTDSVIISDAVAALAAGDRAGIFGVVNRVIMSGQDPARFALDLLGRVRDLMVLSAVPNALEQGLVEIPESQIEEVLDQAGQIPPATLTRFSQVLSDGVRDFRGVTSPRLLLEVLCARMLLPATEDSVEALLQRVESLERGIPAVAPSQPAPSAPLNDAADGPAAGAMSSGMSAREAWRKRNAERKKGAAGGTAAAAQPAQSTPAQPVQQAQDKPSEQTEPVERVEPAGSVGSAGSVNPVQQAPAAEPQPEAPAASVASAEPEPAAAVDTPEVSAEQAQADRMLAMRKRMQEMARMQEMEARAKEAQQREQQTREREGDGGLLTVAEEPAPSPAPSPTPEPAVTPAPAPEVASAVESQPERPQVSVEGVAAAWPEILAAVEGEHAFPVRVLAEQATPLEIDGKDLVIGHSTGALVTRLNAPEYAQALSAAVRTVAGLDGKVRCVVGSRPRSPRAGGQASAAPEEDSSSSSWKPAAQAQPENYPVAGPEPQRPTGFSAAMKSVAERRRKIEEAKRAANPQAAQARSGQLAQPSQVGQPNRPSQPEQQTQGEARPHQRPSPAGQSYRRHVASTPGGPAQDEPPLPPEPMEEFAPPESYDAPPPDYDDAPPPEDPYAEEDTSEYYDAMNQEGNLDHRTLKDVVIELLEKELGAKPM